MVNATATAKSPEKPIRGTGLPVLGSMAGGRAGASCPVSEDAGSDISSNTGIVASCSLLSNRPALSFGRWYHTFPVTSPTFSTFAVSLAFLVEGVAVVCTSTALFDNGSAPETNRTTIPSHNAGFVPGKPAIRLSSFLSYVREASCRTEETNSMRPTDFDNAPVGKC